MKKLALILTAVFLVGTAVNAKTTNALEDNSITKPFNNGYGNSFIFTEGGIEFSVFPDGQFDFYVPEVGPDINVSINTPNVSFSFNKGYDYSPYVQYDDFGAIVQIENTPIYYDYYGRVTQVGNVDINYNNNGRIARVGGLYVHYDNYRNYAYSSGYINVYNRAYVYRPWHVYYTIPAPNFCVVYSHPYRQHYKPVRYHYYRPYANNYRTPVHYDYRRAANYNSGRRGTTSGSHRVSDRYRQEYTPSKGIGSTNRGNIRSKGSNDSRVAGRNDNAGRSSSGNRLNESTRNSKNGNLTRSTAPSKGNNSQRSSNTTETRRSTPTKSSQSQRSASSDQYNRSKAQRSESPNRTRQVVERKSPNRNTSSIGKTTERVNNLPNRKPNSSNTRISNTKQQQRSTTQRSSSSKTERASKQPSSRSTSKRGNL